MRNIARLGRFSLSFAMLPEFHEHSSSSCAWAALFFVWYAINNKFRWGRERGAMQRDGTDMRKIDIRLVALAFQFLRAHQHLFFCAVLDFRLCNEHTCGELIENISESVTDKKKIIFGGNSFFSIFNFFLTNFHSTYRKNSLKISLLFVLLILVDANVSSRKVTMA